MILSQMSINHTNQTIHGGMRYDVLYNVGLQIYNRTYRGVRFRIEDNLTAHVRNNCGNAILIIYSISYNI